MNRYYCGIDSNRGFIMQWNGSVPLFSSQTGRGAARDVVRYLKFWFDRLP